MSRSFTEEPAAHVAASFLNSDIDREQSSLSQIAVSDMGPNLDRLWSYVCPLTKGRNVSCLAWNKSNPVS